MTLQAPSCLKRSESKWNVLASHSCSLIDKLTERPDPQLVDLVEQDKKKLLQRLLMVLQEPQKIAIAKKKVSAGAAKAIDGEYHSSEPISKSRDSNAQTTYSSRNVKSIGGGAVPVCQKENNRYLLQETKEDVTSDTTNSYKHQPPSGSPRLKANKTQSFDNRERVACLHQLEHHRVQEPRGEEHEQQTGSSKLCQDKCQMSPEKEPGNQSQLEDLENSHSQDIPYVCNTCSKRFSHKRAIISHVKTHMMIKKYTCEKCGKECGTRKRFDLHIHKHKYKCKHEHCKKSFTNVSDFNKHCRRHEDDRPYKCHTCEKQFLYRSHLVDHMKQHFKEKSHQCKICSKSFLQIDKLHAHERIHYGEKPFECKTCGQSFTQNSHLKRHTKIHKGEKAVCKTCGKSIAINNLKVHELIHSDKKPYICPNCGKAFKRNNHLKQHARSHSTKRDLACSECGKLFKSKGPLIFHIKTHSVKKSFKCERCNELFAESMQLKKHQHSCIVEP